jgi:DmsE family decaheme c-type cytochrome
MQAVSRSGFLALIVAVAPFFVWPGASLGQQSGDKPAAEQQEEKPAPDAVCQGCHADYYETYAASKHGQKGNSRGPANHGGCLACHGQKALEHAKQGGGRGVGGIFAFGDPKVLADTKSSVCLGCHDSDRHLAFWDSGRHRKNDIPCNACHALHDTPGAGSTIALKTPNPSVSPYVTTVRTLQYETCTTCHRQIRAQLLKPSHHPIIEGKLKCTDCHNPHGALSQAMVKNETVNDLCTTCHAEKRGPFIWDHPPVAENCLTCHNPHGSNHTRLLTEKAPNVCQDCHDAAQHPGTVYSAQQGWNFGPPATQPSTRLINKGCVNCHFNIHGSNAPAARGQFFLR